MVKTHAYSATQERLEIQASLCTPSMGILHIWVSLPSEYSLMSQTHIETLTSQGWTLFYCKAFQIFLIVCGYDLTIDHHRKRCACVSELAEETAITKHYIY